MSATRSVRWSTTRLYCSATPLLWQTLPDVPGAECKSRDGLRRVRGAPGAAPRGRAGRQLVDRLDLARAEQYLPAGEVAQPAGRGQQAVDQVDVRAQLVGLAAAARAGQGDGDARAQL